MEKFVNSNKSKCVLFFTLQNMATHARLSRSRPGFERLSGQVSWVSFFGVFLALRKMSVSFRPTRSLNMYRL